MPGSTPARPYPPVPRRPAGPGLDPFSTLAPYRSLKGRLLLEFPQGYMNSERSVSGSSILMLMGSKV